MQSSSVLLLASFVNQYLLLIGIVHQFRIYIFFLCQQKKSFLWKVHLDITSLRNWENRVAKVSPTEYCYLSYIYNTDWLWAPYFLMTDEIWQVIDLRSTNWLWLVLIIFTQDNSSNKKLCDMLLLLTETQKVKG